MKTIVWFRQDLRLRDNPAFFEAAKERDDIIPLYITDPSGTWPTQGASLTWLKASLAKLSESLREKGGELIVKEGSAKEVLADLVRKYQVEKIYWNRLYDPKSVKEGNEIKVLFGDRGVECRSFKGTVLLEPWEVKSLSGKPYRVFTPFWKTSKPLYKKLGKPLSVPKTISFVRLEKESSDKFEKIRVWEQKVLEYWNPGEQGAQKEMKRMSNQRFQDYAAQRDFPSLEATSRLSPHLHYGEVSPIEVLHYAYKNSHSEPFVRQLAWREFAHSLLYYCPQTLTEPLNPQFKSFGWMKNKKNLSMWKKGKTGYPIVDAGMRELWETGTMHNRVRMIVASFLVKHLLITWQEGARWFWDTLVDADLANNTMGWQWVAGCGADAAPYFRIFNPIIQAKKFDPQGVYIKRWIPELSSLPTKYLYAPWECSSEELKAANVALGKTYPKPIVDHAEARQRALGAYKKLTGN